MLSILKAKIAIFLNLMIYNFLKSKCCNIQKVYFFIHIDHENIINLPSKLKIFFPTALIVQNGPNIEIHV